RRMTLPFAENQCSEDGRFFHRIHCHEGGWCCAMARTRRFWDPGQIRRDYAQGTSMRTWVTADEIADTVLWLASPAAAKISGQAIAIDGHTETNSA
ncbi:MAG: SDR family oxidoreductase, partial [Boseongicola sp.]